MSKEVVFPQVVVVMQTAVGMVTTVSRIIHLPGVGEPWHSEMTSRRPWWSDRTHKYRRSTASLQLPPKPCPFSPARLPPLSTSHRARLQCSLSPRWRWPLSLCQEFLEGSPFPEEREHNWHICTGKGFLRIDSVQQTPLLYCTAVFTFKAFHLVCVVILWLGSPVKLNKCIFFHCGFLGCFEVTDAKSSYCSSTSRQPGSYAHTPQGT